MAHVIRIKRALAAGNVPTLSDGELGLDYLSNPPKLWTSVPTTRDPSGILDLLDINLDVEDAPEDTVYGRMDGQWVPVIKVATTPPPDPVTAQLWFDPTSLQLYIEYQDQWIVAVNPPAELGGTGGGSGGIPEPESSGNFLRTGDATWVAGLPLSGGEINGNLGVTGLIKLTAHNNTDPQSGDLWYDGSSLLFTQGSTVNLTGLGSRVGTLETTVGGMSGFATRITDLETDSTSFETRISDLESAAPSEPTVPMAMGVAPVMLAATNGTPTLVGGPPDLLRIGNTVFLNFEGNNKSSATANTISLVEIPPGFQPTGNVVTQSGAITSGTTAYVANIQRYTSGTNIFPDTPGTNTTSGNTRWSVRSGTQLASGAAQSWQFSWQTADPMPGST